MASRLGDIEALLERARKDLAKIENDYGESLSAKQIDPALRIDIKNLCGNLRSVLDYLARDIREAYCQSADPKARFYFPILPDRQQFEAQVDKWFPDLRAAAPDVWASLEGVQPYQIDFDWIAQFNRVNNDNKHKQLVEQTRAERHEVRVTTQGGGRVSWSPRNVRFGSGVSIGGVPVDPTTQMPVPDSSQRVQRITWVDFQFEGIGVSALGLLRRAVEGIREINQRLQKHL
jgi:hypothetical protein